MPRNLERQLMAAGYQTKILNAGVPGSDVFFMSTLIEHCLIEEEYHKFILAINTSDLYDYAWFGGRERFREDGTTVSKIRPEYMKIYKRSHLARAVMHVILRYDHSFYSRQDMELIKEEAIRDFTAEIIRLDAVVKRAGGEMMVFFYPYPRQYSKRSSSFIYDYAFLQSIQAQLRDQAVSAYDLEADFAAELTPKNYLDYSWNLDKHFNRAGYALFADIVYNYISRTNAAFFNLEKQEEM